VLGCVAFAAWVAFFVLPYMDETTSTADPTGGNHLGQIQRPKSPQPNAAHPAAAATTTAAGSSKSATGGRIPPPPPHVERHVNPSDIKVLEPWGYNRDRNVARWKAIAASISNDLREGLTKADSFSVVDYGADQGYFSISTAHAFPGAFVTAVELGGKGGTLWNKTAIDVHVIQEGKIRDHLSSTTGGITLCQGRVYPSHFAALRHAKQFHTYQYMLSVFHWFPMKTRGEFEKVVVDLFANARTTFIELPTIGDNGALIRKQEGYRQWVRWYDGRTDVAEILRAAIKAQGMKATVTLVASLPWVKWQRSVYRVDVQAGADPEAAAAASGDAVHDEDPFAAFSYSCEKHREVYACADRSKHQACPAAPSGGVPHQDN
jgi:hypothetical protein